MTVLFIQVSFFNLVLRNLLETVPCINNSFHHYDLYDSSPHHHADHHYCSGSDFHLIIDFVRRGNHIA